MNVNFNLESSSFINSSEDLDYIYKRIDELDLLFQNIEKINKRKIELDRPKDTIYKNLDIYDQLFYENKPVSDFIYGTLDISSDYKKLLRAIIDKYTTFYERGTVDKNIFFYNRGTNIYDEKDLRDFYHNFFNTLNNGENFFYGIKIHFPKLTLSENVQNTLSAIETDLPNFSIKIIKTLDYLSNRIKGIFEDKKDIRATLETLTEETSFHASLQGKSKDLLNFEFEYIDKEKVKKKKTICCDPHVKYNRGEVSKGDKEYYRLYFQMGDPEIDNGNILIGHIGKHIE
ncbi:hypothetical protein [Aliarcobacter vitoriensis]|uniref:Uncharacterized protein n=1 Tax=Aliarcobacter vitoriensis TaxID=2011099 RepID=A0A366MUY6_9BACT|nr:hypothetical protein [Aliarcobacter vitoriensis]RBQ29299.1 hypothetical protein CRU91_04240 [Aliarcobacter vitoriensis]